MRRRELADASAHQSAEQVSVIHTTAHGWSFDLGGETWSGGDDGKLFVAPFSTIPDNPSLPGLTDLASIPALLIFGSDGAARTADATDGAQLLPALDDSAAPGTNGFNTGCDQRLVGKDGKDHQGHAARRKLASSTPCSAESGTRPNTGRWNARSM